MSQVQNAPARPIAFSPLRVLGLALLFVTLLGGLAAMRYGERPDGEVTLSMESMRFDNAVLRLPAGRPATIHLRNDDGYAHSFDLDAFDVHVPLAGKERITIHFTPDRPGTYTFYCGAAGHRAAGMAGTLIVEP